MKKKIVAWIADNVPLVCVLITVATILVLFYGLGLLIDWYNIPEVATKIDILAENLMVTEWFAVTGFIIALAVPTVFFIIGEDRRKKDKKDSQEQRDKDIEKQEKEFQIIYEQNEKQFICNLIVNWNNFRLSHELITYLYGNISRWETFEKQFNIYVRKIYDDCEFTYIQEISELFKSDLNSVSNKKEEFDEFCLKLYNAIEQNNVDKQAYYTEKLNHIVEIISTPQELVKYKRIFSDEYEKVNNDLELVSTLSSSCRNEVVRERLLEVQKVLLELAKDLQKISEDTKIGSKIHRRENESMDKKI